MATKKAALKPKITTAPVLLKAPVDIRRDAEYRAYDDVMPDSGAVPPCTFSKKLKLAESCKVKLFFAGPAGVQALKKATGRDYAEGAYLRVCGPKTNDTVEVIPAGDVATGMKRAESVCGCVEEAGSDGAACVKKAGGLSGLRRRRASSRKRR
jgi:hypothetical protein